jgi:cholesterol oxidase
MNSQQETFDYVIVGSGFGGSVSAMRLTEKGYSVLVMERGKRFRDQDFARTSWHVRKYIWLPVLKCFGILQISSFRDVIVLHGSGVGGGSLGYANVLMEPGDKMFAAPAWSHLADWKALLRPHYRTARRMLGVDRNPCLWPADEVMHSISTELGTTITFQPTDVGTFFGEPGKTVPDPFFGGEGPDRTGCLHCGGCMVGCRHGAKNTLVKNYLYFAEKWGAQIWPETEVRDVRPLPPDQPDGAHYEVSYRSSTRTFANPEKIVRTRNVVFSAGALGTLRLLFRCRDVTRSLSKISQRLGDMVRTNSEALLGSSARDLKTNYSEGIAITSIFHADDVTTIEPVRYPAGSSLMRFLSGPLVDQEGSIPSRLVKTLVQIFTRPIDFAKTHILPGWAQRTTIILVMQTEDNRIRLR